MDGSAFMHNKFCIIDDEVLITGSFNWTYNASKSFENSIVIRNDYKLIKAYLHEFEDLKNYSALCKLKRKKRVIHLDGSKCGSLSYNIGIFGYENDTDGSQVVAIWSVCNAHRIAECIGKLIIKDREFGDDIDDDTDPYYFSGRERRLSKEDMLAQFKAERENFLAPRNFFRNNLDNEVHAYGFVRERDQGFKATRASDVEYSVDLTWRHIYWRKIIPKELFEEEGNIDRIIEKHKPGGYFG